jgi:hypothetical protein
MPRFARLSAAMCGALLPLALSAQKPLALAKPDAEFKEPFAQIGSLRELRDGRVLVVDPRDRTLQLIDFRSGVASQVGRQGAGPGEYGYPGRIVALPGDTSALHDPANGRYLLITPEGKPGETFKLAEAVATRLGNRGSIPRATDAQGRIFFEGAPFTAGRGGPTAANDSVPVMRYDRLTKTLDTLTYVQLGKGNVRITNMPGGGVSISVGIIAFMARDDWGPTPEGGVAVVRVGDYHVDRYTPSGARTAGPLVKFTPVRVTDAEKDTLRAERKARMSPRQAPAGGTDVTGPPPPELEFPEVKPPFVHWETFARPNGELWVLRSHKASDVPVYDIFNTTGTMVGQVALPARGRLVGFGNATAYVVRRDEDDLEYLQRYSLPAEVRFGR